MNIHFICNGNIFRSIIAEAYLKSLKLPNLAITSSGTMAAAHREANRIYQPQIKQALEAHGLGEFYKSEPTQLTQTRTNNQDITVVLNKIAYTNAERIVTLPDNTTVWDIDDIGEGKRSASASDRSTAYEDAYTEITTKVDELVTALI